MAIERRPEETQDNSNRLMLKKKSQFPDIIGFGLAGCMRQREHHQHVAGEIDQWFHDLPTDKIQRNKMLDEARTQMDTARQAIELFHMRFRQLAVNAKGQ